MALFIVRPRQPRSTSALSLGSVRLSREDRARQTSAVRQWRGEADPVEKELKSWIKDQSVTDLAGDAPGATSTPVNGTRVLEMTDAKAEQLRRELGEVLVLRDHPLELIRPDRSATAGPTATVSSGQLWHLEAIGLKKARKAGFKGTGAGVTVAVLDTGIDQGHAELDARVTDAVTFDVATWRAVPMAPSKDTDGHGTHVAGLVCGKKVGVAPGARVANGLMLPGGSGNLSDFVLALEWAASRPDVQIMNMSAGIRGFVEGMSVAIEELLAVGILPVIATGNEGRNRTRSPGNYDSVLSVGATNVGRQVAGFSSSGSISIGNHVYSVPDLVAPGEAITSCVPGGYDTWNGTSMATPVVSGVAALILERHPTITVLDLMETIRSACEDLGHSADRQGAGLVQVAPAVTAGGATRKTRRAPKR